MSEQVDGWINEWMNVKAFLRIAYSIIKLVKKHDKML
jgi:hypothetical protein